MRWPTYIIRKYNTQTQNPAISDQSANKVLVGADRDAHGCIGSAGYSWCEPKNKCLRILEEACYASPEQEIQYLLAKKYNKPVTDVTVTPTKQIDNFMAGGVSFAAKGLPKPGEGGCFWRLGKETRGYWFMTATVASIAQE